MRSIVDELRKALSHSFKSPLERERDFYRSFRELSEAIEAAPDSLTHFVLRGELLLERGECERAKADFENARQLADQVDIDSGWGLIEQVMGDRASLGLNTAQDRLRRGTSASAGARAEV